jgi:hypothetical protein
MIPHDALKSLELGTGAMYTAGANSEKLLPIWDAFVLPLLRRS